MYAATALNPAAGIYIQRIVIYDSEPTSGTLCYTRYGNVSDLCQEQFDFYYDGQGLFRARTKDTICRLTFNAGWHYPSSLMYNLFNCRAGPGCMSNSGCLPFVWSSRWSARTALPKIRHLMMDPSKNNHGPRPLYPLIRFQFCRRVVWQWNQILKRWPQPIIN